MAGEGSQREEEVLVDRKESCLARRCSLRPRLDSLTACEERRPSRLCRLISVPTITATPPGSARLMVAR